MSSVSIILFILKPALQNVWQLFYINDDTFQCIREFIKPVMHQVQHSVVLLYQCHIRVNTGVEQRQYIRRRIRNQHYCSGFNRCRGLRRHDQNKHATFPKRSHPTPPFTLTGGSTRGAWLSLICPPCLSHEIRFLHTRNLHPWRICCAAPKRSHGPLETVLRRGRFGALRYGTLQVGCFPVLAPAVSCGNRGRISAREVRDAINACS